jgi:rhamnulokinase
MSELQTYLGVDVGAESGRIIAGLWDGRRIRLDEIHRFSNATVPVGETLRWDLLHLWKEIHDGLIAAENKLGDACSIGVDTWGVDYVLQDRRGEWLGLPFAYRDRRTQGLVGELCALVPRREIFEASGLQFMEINTLVQLLAAQRSHPHLLAQAHRMLMIPDWIHWALCGAGVTEFSNATTTQCLHPKTRHWSTGLMDKLGIPTHFLPEIVPAGTDLGPLRRTVSDSTGLSKTRVVAPATHDTGSAVVGVPAEDHAHGEWAYISSGTWSLMGVEVREANLSEDALCLNFTNEGGADGTYRLLKNIMGLWLVQQLKRGFAARGILHGYPELVQLASQAAPLRSLINPDSAQFLRATDMINTIREFCQNTGQAVPESEGALVRCVLESLALRYRDVLASLEKLTGKRVQVIHIVGGGSRNSLLNQFTADACQRPVIAGPVEATAIGNVLFQARASGELRSLSEIRAVIRHSFSDEMKEFHPQAENLAVWDAAAARWNSMAF